jgi:hypothetical protein
VRKKKEPRKKRERQWIVLEREEKNKIKIFSVEKPREFFEDEFI